VHSSPLDRLFEKEKENGGDAKGRKEGNRGDGSFILRDVYAQYCRYMDGYTHCRYNTKQE